MLAMFICDGCNFYRDTYSEKRLSARSQRPAHPPAHRQKSLFADITFKKLGVTPFLP